MTIIDLLNKIAKGEELPEMIKFHNMLFTLSTEEDGEKLIDYMGGVHDVLFNSKWWLTNNLNDEVEIIKQLGGKNEK